MELTSRIRSPARSLCQRITGSSSAFSTRRFNSTRRSRLHLSLYRLPPLTTATPIYYKISPHLGRSLKKLRTVHILEPARGTAVASSRSRGAAVHQTQRRLLRQSRLHLLLYCFRQCLSDRLTLRMWLRPRRPLLSRRRLALRTTGRQRLSLAPNLAARRASIQTWFHHLHLYR